MDYKYFKVINRLNVVINRFDSAQKITYSSTISMVGIISSSYLLSIQGSRKSIFSFDLKLNHIFESNLKLWELCVQIRCFFWSVFSCIQSEYRKKLRRALFTQWNCCNDFIIFSLFSPLKHYHYWFSLHQCFCTKLQKRLILPAPIPDNEKKST